MIDNLHFVSVNYVLNKILTLLSVYNIDPKISWVQGYRKLLYSSVGHKVSWFSVCLMYYLDVTCRYILIINTLCVRNTNVENYINCQVGWACMAYCDKNVKLFQINYAHRLIMFLMYLHNVISSVHVFKYNTDFESMQLYHFETFCKTVDLL